mgnify:CR=1 FL=1
MDRVAAQRAACGEAGGARPALAVVSDDEGRLSVCAGKVYLVSGGLGSVGFAMARRLVERGATSVVLLSRRTRAEGEVGAWIEACAARGVAVQLCSVDVGDEQGMRQLVQRLATEGEVGGVVHAAGTISYVGLGEMGNEAWWAVCKPKVQGAR